MYRIETARLRLRPFTLADADPFYTHIASNPSVMRYLRGGQPLPREVMEERIALRLQLWEKHGWGLWVLEDRLTGEFSGQCGLHPLDDTPEVEIAYAIREDHWGRGYVTEAAHATLRFGFETVGLDRVVAVALPENAASQRVMVKIGMTYEGMRHVYGSDLPYYAINRADYTPHDGEYHLTQAG